MNCISSAMFRQGDKISKHFFKSPTTDKETEKKNKSTNETTNSRSKRSTVDKRAVETHQRKINRPMEQMKAAVYFAEQSALLDHVSTTFNMVAMNEALVRMEREYNNKKEGGDETFATFVATNPLLNQHKDNYGRRNGVFERHRLDANVLPVVGLLEPQVGSSS